jgi:hypothetical protein
MLNKRADQITEADLQGFVQAGATEDERLEFKRDMYGTSDSDRREMIRDIVSVANLHGGLILIGVEEDDEGAACAIPGVDGTGHDHRIMSSAQANVAPRLAGLRVVAIPLENERSAIAVDAPESLSAPHMTTFQEENVFWLRHGRQKAKMSVDEVQLSFFRRIQAGSVIEEFFGEQRRHENLEYQDGRVLMLQAAPVFMRDDLIDVSEPRILQLMRSAPGHPQLGSTCSSGDPRPSLYGRRVEAGDWREYLELRRQGYMEFSSAQVEDDGAINGWTILGLTYSFVHLYRRILDVMGIGGSVLVGLTLIRTNTASLLVPRRVARATAGDAHNVWDKAQLEVPLVYVQDLQVEADEVVRRLNDRLWNAFGYESCLALRSDGSVIKD